MQSLDLSPTCAKIHVCNSRLGKPKINPSVQHYSSPNGDTFSNALVSLRRCTQNDDLKLGSSTHAHILKLGLDSDVFIGNNLLSMYSKFGHVKDAYDVFDNMPHRTIVSWTSMISAFNRSEEADAAILLFLQMLEYFQPNEYTLAVVLQACSFLGHGDLIEVVHSFAVKIGLLLDDFLQKCLIDAYAKLGMLNAADKLLQRLVGRDVVSWTSIISGCVSNSNAKRALQLFCNMQEDGIVPNDVTLLTILKACSEICDYKIIRWVHGLIMKADWITKNSLVLNSLIQMYSVNRHFADSVMVFCRFCFSSEGLYPSPETMANLLQGCGYFGSIEVGKGIHGYLIKHGFLPCIVIDNSLINMYAKNGLEDTAFHLFRKMELRDVISWNTIMKCFVNHGQPVRTLRLFVEMQNQGCCADADADVSPDFVTILTSLEACSEVALLTQGQLIHGYLVRTGLLDDIFVQNALIDMYGKSGMIHLAENVFEEMVERDIGSWNSIIAAYGMNGNAASALKAFADLSRSGSCKPNAITFVNALAACAHGGMFEEGFGIFNTMERQYGVKRSMEHFACMVDLLGRAGRVEEAETFIYEMPIQAGPDIWGALLSASVLSSNIAVAEKAAKELLILKPTSSVWRVALSNAYAAAGKWDEVAKVRAELRGLEQCKKEGGWSSVNVDGYEYRFMAGGTNHHQTTMIYEIISVLQMHMRDGSAVGCN